MLGNPSRVLLVDDSPSIRLAVAAAVKRAVPGAELFEAGDAATAVQLFHERSPDVVFLDMIMPGAFGGLGALRAMLKERPSARVIVVSGLPDSHPDVIEAISLGAFARLEKPVRSEAIRGVLAELDAEAGVPSLAPPSAPQPLAHVPVHVPAHAPDLHEPDRHAPDVKAAPAHPPGAGRVPYPARPGLPL